MAYSLLTDSSNAWVTNQHKQAIIYAALFSDTMLDSDSFIKIRSSEDLEAGQYSNKEKEIILKHALDASQEYQQCESIPNETIKIIMQHHGTLNGIGFSKQLGGSTSLHPLTYFYIVAEEFSLKILTDPNKKVNVRKIVQDIQSYYDNTKIDQAITILRKQLQIN
jgi:hypothetical protein